MQQLQESTEYFFLHGHDKLYIHNFRLYSLKCFVVAVCFFLSNMFLRYAL